MTSYWPLLLMLLIPYLWWIQRSTRSGLSPKHLQLSTVIRSGIIALLAMALTQPVIYRSASRLSVIYLLDISQSISPAEIEYALQWIRESNDSGNPDHVRYIPFGSNAAIFQTLDQLRTVRVAENPDSGTVGQNATNIENAIDGALQNFAPHHLKRLVLMTDGNENAGDTARIIGRLKNEGVQVYTLPLRAGFENEAWVESVIVPPDVASDELFPIEVHVYSRVNTSAQIAVRHGQTTLDSRMVQLVSGLNRVTFEVAIKNESGPVTIEAEVSAANDSFAGNNLFRQSVVINGTPKVLYIEGHSESARYMEAALRREGFTVNTVGPEAVPANVVELDAYDAVLLSDVARSSLNENQMKAIATYVRDLGGGFVFAGGETTYGGDGGYSETDIERILPITFDARRPHRSVAMIVALDKSGSMGGPNFDLAKEATKAPLQFLADSDKFGVVAFDSRFFWAVPFQGAEHRTSMIQWISTLVPGGETDIYPALQAANVELARDSSEVKHIILLSDGHTPNDPFRALVESMAQARITVSTVALGTAADRPLLANIAEWGKGRAYFIEDASRVPQIFTDETELTTGTTLREGPFTPVVKKSVEALKGIDFKTAPRLLGYVATRPKEKAEVILESGRKDPVLVRWQHGLGKTAAFTSDTKNRWAADWLGWSGYSKFWSQLVRETMRPRDNSEFDLRVIRHGEQARVVVEAIQKNGEFRNRLESELRVVAPDQAVANVPLHQAGPGFYEAKVPLDKKGAYIFRVAGETGGPSRTLEYSYPDEFHFYPANVDSLRAISDETDGRFQPMAGDVFATRGETTPLPVSLWPYLAALALILYIGDVYLRRIRLFE